MAASTSFLLVLTGLGGPWQIAFNFSPLFTQATPELIARYPASGRYLIVARLNNHPCSPSTSLSLSLSPSPSSFSSFSSSPSSSAIRGSSFSERVHSSAIPPVEGGSTFTEGWSKPMIMNAADRCVSLFGGTEGRKEGGRKGGSLFAWNCSRGGTGYLGRVSKLGAEMRPSLFAPRHPVSDRGDLESTKCVWTRLGRFWKIKTRPGGKLARR